MHLEIVIQICTWYTLFSVTLEEEIYGKTKRKEKENRNLNKLV